MTTFNPHSTHPERAVQAWQILVGKAMNRQTVTYGGLALLMYRQEAAGVLAQILDRVARYCTDNGLPPLTAIVVSAGEGKPGAGFRVTPATVDAERERVYQTDWYDVRPPSTVE